MMDMEDIGYGIHKMMGWEQLTGEKVTFDSDIDLLPSENWK